MLRAWAVLHVLAAAAPPPSVSHSSPALDCGPPDGCLDGRRCGDDEPDPPRTAPVPAGAATAARSAWHELPVARAWRGQRPAARAGSLPRNKLRRPGRCHRLASFGRSSRPVVHGPVCIGSLGSCHLTGSGRSYVDRRLHIARSLARGPTLRVPLPDVPLVARCDCHPASVDGGETAPR